MNRPLLAAALLAGLTSAVHLFLGTPEVTAVLLRSNAPPVFNLMMFACWHLVSVALVLSTFALLWAARPRQDNSAMVRLISTMWLGFGVVFVVVALNYAGPDMLFKLPQWVLLLPVGVLGMWGSGARSHRRTVYG